MINPIITIIWLFHIDNDRVISVGIVTCTTSDIFDTAIKFFCMFIIKYITTPFKNYGYFLTFFFFGFGIEEDYSGSTIVESVCCQ